MSPATEQPPAQPPASASRPRAKSSAFSFHSDKSSKHERKISEGEKRKTHYDPNTKANPNAAMNEIQPIAAALEKPTLQSLRSFQHTDSTGNPIVDPDLSNPTRSRWERPLDTIRSFEAAIDGEYKRRVQTTRGDQSEVMSAYGSRRNSYYGGHEQNRYSQANNSPYNRQSGRDSYDAYGAGGPVGGYQRMRYGNRMQSDPGWNRGGANNVYPQNGYQQSRDTVNTNGSNGSHSDGPHSNEPSSDNSSIERGVPVRPPQHDMGDPFGYSSFNRGPIREEYGQQGPSQQQGPYFPSQQQNQGVPPPPPKHATPSAPIKLGNSGPPDAGAHRPPLASKKSDDKRKSWFKKRFSKD
ncbi:hypothetical protein IAQ61_004361 [Plenodomus lingam]|uniref:DUF2406 domain-containing protein n=1 Tax=Leptosphaeria maculans (strain JN3 / isolate v23.1.3 / race Av1-4-5-6-7-8) TaxID=985895 RepID=E4ZVA3_LEPMJ|nr:hypothetical protein LEMA_P026810.1 [Plenodomus lingam JN3]KAH9873734.1 hypothetical protein IAQ61_004361 [Plenodomus lingam]CBX95529.1 hypothetical protein LEMA_P026810.1 [Plenodomus lingam JN3]